MKYWVKTKIGTFMYRDKEDRETCEDCINNSFVGKCNKNRLCIRKTTDEGDDLIFCYEKNKVKKQAVFEAKIASQMHNKLYKSALIASEKVNEVRTISYHNAKKLNATIGQKVERVEAGCDKKTQDKELRTIRKLVEQIESEYNFVDLLTDTKELSEIDKTHIRAHQLLVGETYLYQEDLRKKNLRVEVEDTDIELLVEYSLAKSSIGQVLNNICKYCKQGTTIDVSVSSDDSHIYISFKMISVYFDNSDVSRLKKLFQRGNDKLYKTKGEGIGLYAVDLFQRKHGGSLEMISDPYSRFDFNNTAYSKNVITISFKK